MMPLPWDVSRGRRYARVSHKRIMTVMLSQKSFGFPPFRGSTTPTLEDRCTVFRNFNLLILDKSVGSFLEAL